MSTVYIAQPPALPTHAAARVFINKNVAGHFSTTDSYPNPLKDKTIEQIYGKEKAKEWKENFSKGMSKFWNSIAGKIQKEKFRIAANEEVAKGTHLFQTDERFTKQNQIRIENGTHNWMGPENNRQKVLDGTHNWLGPDSNNKRIANGTHNWLDKEAASQRNKKRLAEDNHPFTKVMCLDDNDKVFLVPREEYFSKKGTPLAYRHKNSLRKKVAPI